MDELADVGGHAEFLQRGALERARPFAALDLAENDISHADRDDVPLAEGGGRAGAAITRGLQERHGAMLILRALALGVLDHGWISAVGARSPAGSSAGAAGCAADAAPRR